MSKLVGVIEKIQIFIGSFALISFFIAIIVQIITRYLGISVTWTEEGANYSFIWAIFLGAAVMLNRREHFAFDTLLNKMSGKKHETLQTFIDILLIVFNLFITYYGFLILNHFWNYRWENIPELNMGYVWLVIPIMSISMILYSLNHIINKPAINTDVDVEGGL